MQKLSYSVVIELDEMKKEKLSLIRIIAHIINIKKVVSVLKLKASQINKLKIEGCLLKYLTKLLMIQHKDKNTANMLSCAL